MTNPILFDAKHVWGYRSLKNSDCPDALKTENFQRAIHWLNGLNAASIALSPIIGIIRIIGATFLLVTSRKAEESRVPFDLKAAKRFLRMQMGRGVMELFFLGPILGTVVDGIMTCKYNEVCCFKKA